MTEKDLQKLGFTRHDDCQSYIIKDDGAETPESYYYYVYDVTDGLNFISSASDESLDDIWYVEFFNTLDTIRFYGYEEVQTLIKILESAKLKTL